MDGFDRIPRLSRTLYKREAYFLAHDVFISYSKFDKVIATALCSGLEANRVRCWIAPRDVLAGSEYGESIINAISTCRIVVLVFSAHSNDSAMVRKEIERAVSKEKIVIPFRIEDIEPSESMEFFLSGTHWLDALTPSMDRHIQSLAMTVIKFLAPDNRASIVEMKKTNMEIEIPRKKDRKKVMVFSILALLMLTAAVIFFGSDFFNHKQKNIVDAPMNFKTQEKSKADQDVSSQTAKVSNEVPLAAVAHGGKWGFIDMRGNFVIPPKYVGARDFKNGLAGVAIEDPYKYGFIDKTGTMVIPERYDGVLLGFNEGMALVVDKNGRIGYIDKLGNYIIKPTYEQAREFSGGVAPVKAQNRWGIIDTKGNYLVQPQFVIIGPFQEGLAPAIQYASSVENLKFGYIDKSARFIIAAQFKDATPFREGLAAVRSSEKTGFIDKDGKMVILEQFEDTLGFSEGLAAVKIGNKWGYIDRAGKIIIPLKYDKVFIFSSGLAAVMVNNKWGFIDKKDNMVIAPQYDNAGAFN